MKKIIILAFILSICSFHLLAQDGDEFKENIISLLDLQDVKTKYSTIIREEIELQKKAFPHLKEKDWFVLELKLSEKYLSKLYDDLIPQYEEHFSLEEIALINKFYQSDLGEKWFEVNSDILEPTGEASNEWRTQITEYLTKSLADRKEEDLSPMFEKVLDNCGDFKEGDFQDLMQTESFVLIERTEKLQTRYLEGNIIKHKMEWLTDCKYKIIPIDDKNKKLDTDNALTVNIYEVDGKTYKYVTKDKDGKFKKGKLKKLN